VISYTPRTLYPREGAPGTHWIGGWVGTRVVLDAVGDVNFEPEQARVLYP